MQMLVGSPLLVLFVVAALGYLLGHIQVGGFSLGIAAVLFAGLGVGAMDARLALPEILQQLGLVMFVYTIGLASGPGFFRAFGRRGIRDALVTVGILVIAASLTTVAAKLAGLSPAAATGLFAGSLTNTPALAAVVDTLKVTQPEHGDQAVIMYSLAYPMGVLGILLVLGLYRRWTQRGVAPTAGSDAGQLENVTVRISTAAGKRPSEVARGPGYAVTFGRYRRSRTMAVVSDAVQFARGDLVTVVGHPAELPAAIAALGELAEEHIDLDRHVLDFRRMFVSKPEVTARPLAELRLTETLGAVITRIRRGDVELLPHGQMQLELGDRIRVVAPRERMPALAALVGDSYRQLSEVNVIAFAAGILIGLLLGHLPIPLPGGQTLKLGLAGGPLIAGLVLGKTGRTGRLVWSLPYSANLTLRQLGMLLFLATVGTRSGHAFAHTVMTGGGAALRAIALGAMVTMVTSMLSLFASRRWLGASPAVAEGRTAGLHTQPAALAFATACHGDTPNLGYASAFPIATIAKIVIAQLMLGYAL